LSNSKLKSPFDKSGVRYIQLSLLKSKIIDAMRFSERYWLIYKRKTFGLGTIIDLTYKKFYIEILFFTNEDVMQRGVPLVKINTPTETQYDFNEVIVNPDFDEDGTISPSKILKRVNNLIDKEINYHLNVLNTEIQLLSENFENYPIEDNPYFRKILIYYPNLVLKLRIRFENYPNVPSLAEKKQLIIKKFKEPISEKIKEKLFEYYLDSQFLRYGKEIKLLDEEKEFIIEKQPDTIFQKFINKIKSKFRVILKEKTQDTFEEFGDLEEIIKEKNFNNLEIIKNWNVEKPSHINDVIKSIIQIKEKSQLLILNNVTFENILHNVSFKIHRGQSLGVYHNSLYSDKSANLDIVNILFEVISGEKSNFSGTISIFGKEIHPGIKNKIEGIFFASENLDSKMEHLSIKNAINRNIYIRGKRKSRKKLLNNALEATGLLNRKHEKIAKLSKSARLLVSISRALLTKQKIILISIPLSEMGRLESEQFNRYVEKIKKKFHVIFIIHGPQNIVSNCDRIITIKDNKAEIGTINHFISKIPQSGEILTIELNNPIENALNKMLDIDSAVFIEERKNERYKIYCIKENPEEIINKIMNTVGRYIYNFKRHKATLEEYLEFSNIKEKYV